MASQEQDQYKWIRLATVGLVPLGLLLAGCKANQSEASTSSMKFRLADCGKLALTHYSEIPSMELADKFAAIVLEGATNKLACDTANLIGLGTVSADRTDPKEFAPQSYMHEGVSELRIITSGPFLDVTMSRGPDNTVYASSVTVGDMKNEPGGSISIDFGIDYRDTWTITTGDSFDSTGEFSSNGKAISDSQFVALTLHRLDATKNDANILAHDAQKIINQNASH